jgi:hypothetical protein
MSYDPLEPIDDPTPQTKRPFLVGYRKFLVAVLWLGLAVFVVVWCMLTKASSGQITLALWVVGSAGFFSAFFVGGNILVHKWGEFWKVQTIATLSQADSRQEVIYQDSSEDAAWQKAEPKS